MREMPDVQLTETEWTLLELRVREGLSVAAIAQRRDRDARTVTNHFRQIYQKLGVGGDVDTTHKHEVLSTYYWAHVAGRSAVQESRQSSAGEQSRPYLAVQAIPGSPSTRAPAGDGHTADRPGTPTRSPLPRDGLAPFVAGPPIGHPRQFFGRERELIRLFNLWRQPPLQNAAIIGPRRSGKTSLLLYLRDICRVPADELRPGQRAAWLPEPARFRWVYVDFQDARRGSREGFLRYLLTALELPLPYPVDLDHSLDVLSLHLSAPTVVLLDEIGVALARCPELDNTFWEALRALATTQLDGQLAFVLAADAAPAHLALQSRLSSSFFNIFGYTAMLGPLSEPEARALIASSPILFPPTDVDWILEQSGRWPLLLQILCRERLVSLHDGAGGDDWQADGSGQIAAWRAVLEGLEGPRERSERPDGGAG